LSSTEKAAANLNSDEKWLVKLFRMLPGQIKHDVLVDMASNLTFSLIDDRSRYFVSADEDEERHEEVEEFLTICEPERPEITEYGIDWRIDVIERAYQDGLAFGLLGEEEVTLSYAEHLVGCWLEANRDCGLGNDGDFTHERAVEYIRAWRAKFVKRVEKIKPDGTVQQI